MEQKKYLKWYNKIGYGSGDIAGNVVYAFLTFFVMIHLTDTVGLNPGIVGTLMAAAGFIEGGVAAQPESVISMLNVMYLWLPAIFCGLVTFLLTKLNVEKANEKLRNEKKMVSDNA